MKQLLIGGAILTVLALVVTSGLLSSGSAWPGVDEAVVNKYAEQGGRPPWEPYINTGHGDVQLFFFLMAGGLGGFVVGYYYRELFPPRQHAEHEPQNVTALGADQQI